MKVTRSGWLPALAAVLVVSCGDDDNSTNPGTDSPEGRAAVQVAALVGAAVDQVSLAAYAQYLPAPGKPGPAQCQPLAGACSSGSAQYCPGAQGGSVQFAQCDTGEGTVSGSVTFIGTAASGSATVNLQVNGTTDIQASVQYYVNTETNCLVESLLPITVSSPEGSLYGNGQFTFCPGSQVPADGTLSGTVTRGETTYGFALGINPEGAAGDIFLQIFTQGGDPLLYCDGNLVSRTVSCDPAGE